MQETVIVITRGQSLLMESVEAGLRAQGVDVHRWHPQEEVPAVDEGATVVFDVEELSYEEATRLRGCVSRVPGTLLGLERDRPLALRCRVDRVALTGLKDLLRDAATSLRQAVPS